MSSGAGVVVTSVLERFLFGVPFGRVDAIEETPAAGAEQAIDLSAVWGVEVTGEAPRRSITVRTARGPRRIVLGDPTRVRSLPRGSLAPLPLFIEGVTERAAIEGVFVVDQRLGFLIDVDRLAAWEDA